MIKLQMPDYFEQFECIASGCKDNCCYGGWQIDIDKETVDYYMTVQGEFGDRLRAAIDYTDTHCFKLVDGQCPFLDECNLCQIYKELGPEHMGVVCTQFPRFFEYFGEVKEAGIGIACEEGERIVLENTKPLKIITKYVDEELYQDEEFDEKLFEPLMVLRNKSIELMERQDTSFSQKICGLLDMADALQTMINDNDYAAIAAFASEMNFAETKSADMLLAADYELAVAQVWFSYAEMESISKEWDELRDRCIDRLHPEDGLLEYVDIVREYNTLANMTKYENLIKYYIYRYFLKAAYDHDALAKIKLAVSNYIVIRDLDILNYISKTDVDTVHIFSREVEYSQDNIDILYDEFIFGDTFDVDVLKSIIATVED